MAYSVAALTPRLQSRYPLRRSGHYSRELADRVDEWFLYWGLLHDERQRTVFRRTDHTYLAAVCWPSCDSDTLYDLARLAAALMARDHEIDTAPPEQAIPMAHTFRSEVSARYDLGGVTGVDPRLQRTLAHLVHPLLRAGRLLQHSPRHRRTTGRPPARRGEPGYRAVLIQDILSAPRELAGGVSENIVAVLSAALRCPAPRALKEATALYEDLTDTYEQAFALLVPPSGHNPGVRAFASALNDFSTGLIEWTSHSVRYTQAETSNWNQADEIVARGL